MADGGPHANGEEQEILAQYSGWGGLSDAFEPNKDSWHSEYTELKSLLTEEEYAAARSSTLTAFYTPPEVIDAMYTTLRKMGVGAGTILEPSMGAGAFFGQSHSYLYEPTTRLFGVELDSLTGRIARQLYQKANIQITGFEKADLPDYRSPRGLLHRAATPIPAPEGYTMPPDYMAQAGTVSLAYVAELTCPEITEDLYDELQEWEESLL